LGAPQALTEPQRVAQPLNAQHGRERAADGPEPLGDGSDATPALPPAPHAVGPTRFFAELMSACPAHFGELRSAMPSFRDSAPHYEAQRRLWN